QTDSAAAIATLTSKSGATHQHLLLVLEFQELLWRHRDVKPSHVFREANQTTDYMANLSHTFDYSVIGLDTILLATV
ncbi:hypothetical protein LINPERHAP2_LOCUS7455, partial [Linum perenne]